MYTQKLAVYCKRHNLEVIRTYTTLGDEKGSHARAIVKHRETGEQYYLYYDPSWRRKSIERLKREHMERDDISLPPSNVTKQRGWRNTTLDNRKRAERMNRTHEVPEPEEGCNGLCRPDLCLYEATCPIHGVAVMLEGLSNGC